MSTLPDKPAAPTRPLRVLHVDAHALFRHGLRHILSDLGRPFDMAEVDHLSTARAATPDGVDLLLFEVHYPDLTPHQAVELALREFPEAAAVVISDEQDPSLVLDAIEMGTVGYIPKTSTSEVLISALRLVLVGGVYLPRQVLDVRFARTQATAPEGSGCDPRILPDGIPPAPASTGFVPAAVTRSAPTTAPASEARNFEGKEAVSMMLRWPPPVTLAVPARVPSAISSVVDAVLGLDRPKAGAADGIQGATSPVNGSHDEGAPRLSAETLAAMTPRQRQVLSRAARGMSNKAIARELMLSESTVKQHLSSAFKLLGVSTRTQAVFLSTQLGLDQPPHPGQKA